MTTEREIARLTEEWFDAERRRDLEASLSFLHADVVMQAEGAAQLHGVDAARAVWQGFFALPFVNLTMNDRTIRVSQSGDMAWDAGEWGIVLESAGQRTVQWAKSLIVWQHSDVGWKCVAITFSMNPGTAPSPGDHSAIADQLTANGSET